MSDQQFNVLVGVISSLIASILIRIFQPSLKKVGDWLIRTVSKWNKKYSNSIIKKASERLEPSSYNLGSAVSVFTLPMLFLILGFQTLNSLKLENSDFKLGNIERREILRTTKLRKTIVARKLF